MTRIDTLNRTDTLTDADNSVKTLSPLQPVSDALNRIFAPSEEQTCVQKTRSIMGDMVASLADEELETYITEFQYLIDEWLDEFERSAFDGQTLRQVLAQE